MSALALRFLILTVTRTSEVRFASYHEIKDDVWTIGVERTKTGIVHRVPLSDEALKVVQLAHQSKDQELLFPTEKGKAMSDATMSRFMEREGYEARPHGFRAMFRTWAENETDASFAIMEGCLGHMVDGQMARSYQRSDSFNKRKTLMNLWSEFISI